MLRLLLWLVLALLFLVVLSPLLFALPEIPEGARDTLNYDNHCLPISLQIVGRHQGVTPLYTLCSFLDRNSKEIKSGEGWYFDAAHELLKEWQIAHYYQPKESFKTDDIWRAIHERHIGVIVSLKTSDPGSDHAVVLTGFWTDWVSFVDPNSPEKLTHKKIEWFNKYWRGNGLFLDYKPLPSPAKIKRVLVVELEKGKS